MLLPAAGQTWPNLTVEPADQSACPSGTVTFHVEAVGDPTLLFQWRRDGLPIFGGGAYEIATTQFSSRLTVLNVQPSDANSTFDVIVSNTNGVTESDPARVTFPDPAILQPPVSAEVNNGATLSLSVATCGSPAF